MSFVDGLFGLQDRVALVTGASSGLGRHFARTLARAGARVAVAARRTDALAGLVDELRAEGRDALAVPMDVARRASVVDALAQVARWLGEPDVLVNNAGVGDIKPALDYTDEDWERIVGTNLRGAWIVAQEYSRRVIAAARRGNVVNVTSILASRVTGRVSPYAASKAGLKHLTEALALELARRPTSASTASHPATSSPRRRATSSRATRARSCGNASRRAASANAPTSTARCCCSPPRRAAT